MERKEMNLSSWRSEPDLAKINMERIHRSRSLGDFQYKYALEEQMRDRVISLSDELEKSRCYTAELERKHVMDVHSARAHEINASRASQNDLLFKLTMDKDREIQEIKDNARDNVNEKLLELEERKNEELQRLQKEFEYEKEQLINALAGRFREEARNEIGDEFANAKRQMEIDYFKIMSENKRLREDLKMAKDSDENKSEEIRKLYKEYNKAMSKIKRDASQDSMRQVNCGFKP